MINQGIQQAGLRLAQAEKYYNQMQTSAEWHDYHENWVQFLICLAGIYEKINQGSKRDQKFRKCYKKEKEIRKQDPLLNWIHNARNVHEHDLSPSIKFIPGRAKISGDAGNAINYSTREQYIPIHLNFKKIVDYDFSKIPQDKIKITPSEAEMLIVENKKFNIVTAPPKIHLEKAITPCNHREIARLALEYHMSMVYRAADLF